MAENGYGKVKSKEQLKLYNLVNFVTVLRVN